MMRHCNVASKVVIMVRLIEDDKKTSVKGGNIIFELELVKTDKHLKLLSHLNQKSITLISSINFCYILIKV